MRKKEKKNKGYIKRSARKHLAGALGACMLVTSLAPMAPINTVKAADAPYVVSTNRAVYASTSENSYVAAENAVDGNTSTRWGSEWTGNTQWIYVDLGKVTTITGAKINWEGAYATKYRIQFSNDEINWTDKYSDVNGNGGIDTIALTGEARFVRLLCEEKVFAQYGYSLFEFEVLGLNGLTKPTPVYGENIAKGKNVTSSSESNIWWLLAYYPEGAARATNAVDGNKDTLWRSSEEAKDQWITVDLGSKQEIGRVILDWNNDGAGRAYDIQVSDNNVNFTTVCRITNGTGGKKDIPLYANARYVRMMGYGKSATSNGFWVNEFEVYKYVQGEAKTTYSIPALPQASTVQVGSGSYLTNDLHMPQPKLPQYRDQSIQTPIESNDWWQSMLITELGNALSTLPLKVKYEKKGLGILTAGAGWLNDRSVVAENTPDFFVMPGNLDAGTLYNEVSAYSDYSVTARLRDANTIGMESVITKGSPYVYNEFKNTREAQIYSTSISKLVNGSNQTILQNNGDVFTGDHIGIEVTDRENKDGTLTSKSYYALTVPAGTTFKRVGSKINIVFPADNGYMSVASMQNMTQLDYFYQHGYAFIKDTSVTYTFNEQTSELVTNFNVTTELKRAGFTNQTVQSLLPHQWKQSTTSLTNITYPSVRGTLKLHEGNTFSTKDTFYGIVPQFTLPTNSEYNNTAMKSYLEILKKSTDENIKSADAYWQGKSLHPLAMGVLTADQMGEAEYMSLFLQRLRTIFDDWFTYSGADDEYFLYYDKEWGTMYYRVSEFGANVGITDHHFTYGYLVFAASVLATYDEDFYNKYKDMVEHMVRDYANPKDNDPMYPRFRSFDLYEGHSWAGGYADNDSGNNQEAAGESLFGWVGEYLWGVRTGNTDYRNAGIFGFTTELKAVEQYWFNYDNDNWIPEYTHTSVGQVYGSTNFFGTFFHGDPLYVYGIHWLPTSEYLTSYGFNKTDVAELYQGLVDDVNAEKAKRPNDIVSSPDEGWQHITWPIQALSNANAVLAKWDATKPQQNEVFNTYWFVNNLKELGGRTEEVWATGGASATVYKNGGTYKALVWNPTTAPIKVTFRNASGVVGSVTVNPRALVKVNPTIHTTGAIGTSTPVVPVNSGTNPGGNGGTTDPGNTGTAYPIKDVNVAAGKSVTASSYENVGTLPQTITDGDGGTRWSSEHTDNQWISIDLGANYNVSGVKFNWEAAYASSYEVYVSKDGANWTKVFTNNNSKGGVETVTFSPESARFVKMQGLTRALPYGYSLWEMEVFESKDSQAVTNDSVLLSRGKTTTASGSEFDTMGPERAVDGDLGTRWSSLYNDNSWITVDLGKSTAINKVTLKWEEAYGKAYKIQVSENGTNYTTVYETSNSDGGTDDISFNTVNARYVKMQGVQRALPYGYSLYEFEVYGAE